MNKETRNIKSEKQGNCPLCGEIGTQLYKNLPDRLFGSNGLWGFSKCKNHSCELIWLNPRPTKEEINKAYETYYTHSENRKEIEKKHPIYNKIKEAYIERTYGYTSKTPLLYKLVSRLLYLHPGRRSELDWNVFYLPAKKGKLLDVGCGSGDAVEYMKNHDWDAEGIDVDKNTAEIAELKKIKIHIGKLQDKKFKDNTYDVITLNHVIEHLYDTEEVIKESFRILKKTGKIIIATPNSDSLGHTLFKANWIQLDPPRHIMIFNKKPLVNILRKTGFKRIETKTSIRGFNNITIGSYSIKKTGFYDPKEAQTTVKKIYGRTLQLFEWLYKKTQKDSGEEIIIVGEK